MLTEKLSISLPADLARMIRRTVEEGTYASNSEVIREALRMWQDRNEEPRERLDSIRSRIRKAANNSARISDEELGRHFDARLAAAEKKRRA